MNISPEAFFRICDIEYKQIVTYDHFKKQLEKHNINTSNN